MLVLTERPFERPKENAAPMLHVNRGIGSYGIFAHSVPYKSRVYVWEWPGSPMNDNAKTWR